MRLALEDAGMQPSAIGYINAHGTSTPLGDSRETRAIKPVFGEERAYKLPISSTKSMTGHMLGAAGATELAITVLALCRNVAAADDQPPSPIPSATSTTCPNVARHGVDVRVALSNSFGFGGHNAHSCSGAGTRPTAAASPETAPLRHLEHVARAAQHALSRLVVARIAAHDHELAAPDEIAQRLAVGRAGHAQSHAAALGLRERPRAISPASPVTRPT